MLHLFCDDSVAFQCVTISAALKYVVHWTVSHGLLQRLGKRMPLPRSVCIKQAPFGMLGTHAPSNMTRQNRVDNVNEFVFQV